MPLTLYLLYLKLSQAEYPVFLFLLWGMFLRGVTKALKAKLK